MWDDDCILPYADNHIKVIIYIYMYAFSFSLSILNSSTYTYILEFIQNASSIWEFITFHIPDTYVCYRATRTLRRTRGHRDYGECVRLSIPHWAYMYGCGGEGAAEMAEHILRQPTHWFSGCILYVLLVGSAMRSQLGGRGGGVVDKECWGAFSPKGRPRADCVNSNLLYSQSFMRIKSYSQKNQSNMNIFAWSAESNSKNVTNIYCRQYMNIGFIFRFEFAVAVVAHINNLVRKYEHIYIVIFN